MFVLSLQKAKTGVEPSTFAVWSKFRKLDEPDPDTGSLWINPGAELRSTGYTAKFKERNGEDADPLTSPLDVEAIVLAGGGKGNGRLWIGEGYVDPRTIPSLRQVRRGRAPGAPAVETRPRVSGLVVDQLREQVSQQQVLFEQQQEQIRQQQEQIRQQQEASRQMMEWMTANMQCLAPADGTLAFAPPTFPWVCRQTCHSIHLTVLT